MDPVAVIAPSIAHRFMNDFAGKVLDAVARITQVGGLADEELLGLALMGRMAAVAHADLERPVLFPAHELFVHMAFKAEPRCRFRKEEPGL